MVLFFTHIPFVVNHTINATPPERLQQYQIYVSASASRTAAGEHSLWSPRNIFRIDSVSAMVLCKNAFTRHCLNSPAKLFCKSCCTGHRMLFSNNFLPHSGIPSLYWYKVVVINSLAMRSSQKREHIPDVTSEAFRKNNSNTQRWNEMLSGN